MSIEEKQNSPIFQDSNSVEYPGSEREVSNFIKKFYKSNIPVELVSSGSKKKIGKSLQCAKTLNLSKLSGIIEYFPEELYIKVKAGTPIQHLEEELKRLIVFEKNRQFNQFSTILFSKTKINSNIILVE